MHEEIKGAILITGVFTFIPLQAIRRQSNRSVIRLFSEQHLRAMMLLVPVNDQRAPLFFIRPQITDLQPPSITPDPTGMPFARYSS